MPLSGAVASVPLAIDPYYTQLLEGQKKRVTFQRSTTIHIVAVLREAEYDSLQCMCFYQSEQHLR